MTKGHGGDPQERVGCGGNHVESALSVMETTEAIRESERVRGFSSRRHVESALSVMETTEAIRRRGLGVAESMWSPH